MFSCSLLHLNVKWLWRDVYWPELAGLQNKNIKKFRNLKNNSVLVKHAPKHNHNFEFDGVKSPNNTKEKP